MRGFTRNSIWGIMLTLLTVFVVAAQASNCTALLEDALLAVEDNCDRTGRNEACYGYNQVSASFINEVADDFFTQPSDVVGIAEIETIRTAGLNLDSGIWGVATMNIQANLPNTLPGQNVTFMLLGDVEVENGVDPETAFQPSEGIEIIVTAPSGANIRSGADLNFNVVGGARPDEILLADGISEDGEWFRVAYNERVAWVNRIVFDDTIEAVDDLPVLSDDLQTPMQAFYLRTGIGRPECEEVPDNLLMVQGPENIEINITANGADISIGSTLGLRIILIDGQPFLQAIAFAGEIDFMGVRLRPGQFSQACLGEEDSRGQDGNDNDLVVICDPTPAETLDNYGEDWCVMEQLPANLLNYAINILCPGETPVVTGNNAGGIATTSNVEGVNCDSFSLISPLRPVNSGNQTFSWSSVEGEGIQYQLVFYNFEGTEVESFWTSATSHTLNLGQDTSTGGTFSWEVRAYQGDSYACVTFRSQALTRTGDLNPSSSGAFSASVYCIYDLFLYQYLATVNWSNAPSGTVTIFWTDSFAISGTIPGGVSGGTTFNSSSTSATFTSVYITSGSETINFGAC